MKPADLSRLKTNAVAMAARMKLMGHPERLLMLCRMDEGEVSVGQLVELTGLSQSSVSQHLAMMREEGVVSIRSKAQTRLYSLTDPAVRAIIHTLCEICGKSCEPATTPVIPSEAAAPNAPTDNS